MKAVCIKGCRVGVESTLFPLPKDSVKRRLWLNALGLKKRGAAYKNALVCSNHFPNEIPYPTSQHVNDDATRKLLTKDVCSSTSNFVKSNDSTSSNISRNSPSKDNLIQSDIHIKLINSIHPVNTAKASSIEMREFAEHNQKQPVVEKSQREEISTAKETTNDIVLSITQPILKLSKKEGKDLNTCNEQYNSGQESYCKKQNPQNDLHPQTVIKFEEKNTSGINNSQKNINSTTHNNDVDDDAVDGFDMEIDEADLEANPFKVTVIEQDLKKPIDLDSSDSSSIEDFSYNTSNLLLTEDEIVTSGRTLPVQRKVKILIKRKPSGQVTFDDIEIIFPECNTKKQNEELETD